MEGDQNCCLNNVLYFKKRKICCVCLFISLLSSAFLLNTIANSDIVYNYRIRLTGRWKLRSADSFLRNNPDICPSLRKPITKRNDGLHGSSCRRNPKISLEKENENILQELGTLVQNNFFRLQNPTNCTNSKFLICNIDDETGFGSFLHLLTECFFLALGTNRSLIIDMLHPSQRNVFNVLESPSSSCKELNLSTAVHWKNLSISEAEKYRILKINVFHQKPSTQYKAFNMPDNITDLLECSHSNPNAWWAGQFVKYLFKLKPAYQKQFENYRKNVLGSQPFVGIHVRRTDKVLETNLFRLESYMTFAERWFNCTYINKNINVTRRVYIATDDPQVIDEAKKKYKNYEIFHDPQHTIHNQYIENRYTNDGVMGIITDVEMLRMSDYFVGTFSSNVGMLLYELRNADKDSTCNSVSLDKLYRFHREGIIQHIAVENQLPHDGAIELLVGDKINVVSANFPSNIASGYNWRANQTGKYFLDKVRVLPTGIKYLGFL